MNLVVFGGTGGTGAALINSALLAGHSVTAPARDPSRIDARQDRLSVVRADVLDPASLDGTVDGADAVLSALGAARGREPTTVYSVGTANILTAMRGAGVTRFVGVTASPAAPRAEVPTLERFVVHPILYRFFGQSYADMKRMEQVLRDSDLEWTVLRPPMLTNGPATGSYRTAVDQSLTRARNISRADLADAMLRALQDPGTVRGIVRVAN